MDEKPPIVKPRRPVPPRPAPTQLAKLGLVESEDNIVGQSKMDPLHYLLNETHSNGDDKVNDACSGVQEIPSDEKPEETPMEPLIDFSTHHENAKQVILTKEPSELMIDTKSNMLENLLAENAELKSKQSIIQEKYQRVCERFHYVEGKIQRRDEARLVTEKTILSTLEKLQLGLERLDVRMTDERSTLEESINEEKHENGLFKEAMKRFFQVEAQNIKQRRNQLIDVFQSMNMEEEVLKLGGDETTNLAEVAAAYKKQGEFYFDRVVLYNQEYHSQATGRRVGVN